MISKKLLDQKRRGIKVIALPLFPLLYLYFWFKHLLTPKIYRRGIHAITGDTGGGKSLMAHIISKHFKAKGWHVMSNSKFNKDVAYFNIFEYFDDFEQKKEIKNCVIIFDEVQRDFNKRMNRKNEYNAVFIPLIEWLSTHRHQGVFWVYFLTQSWDRFDIQFQDFIQKVHFVFSNLRPSLKAWLRQANWRPIMRPTNIKYFTRKKKEIAENDIKKYVARKGKLKYKKVKPLKMPVSINDLLDFDTYAFKASKILKKRETNDHENDKK